MNHHGASSVRLKFLAAVIAGQSPNGEDVTDVGALPFIQGSAEFGHRSPLAKKWCDVAPKIAEEGDVLVSVRAPVGDANVADRKIGIGRGVAAVRSQGQLSREYLYWFFASAKEVLRLQSTGTTFEAVSSSDLANLRIPVMSGSLRLAIASYLDVETARIDALIDEKCKLIKLLREQSVMVAETVIAPAHDGRQAKLGYFVNLLPGFAFPSESFSANESDVPLLRGVNVAPGAIRWEDNVYWPADQCIGLDRFRLTVGDVVFGMDRPWISSGARVALVDTLSAGALLLQRVCRIRGEKKISNRFVYYVLGSDRFRQSIEFELSGVSVPHISPEQITRFKIPILTFEEQEQRCKEADEEISRIDDLVEVAERMIDALKELRSTTITDAVLGRIDVRPVHNKKELEAV